MRKPKSQEHCINISIGMTGIPKSEDHKKRLSDAWHCNPSNKQRWADVLMRQKGVPLSEQHRSAITASLKGRRRADFSENHKRMISMAKTGRVWITDGNLSKVVLPETPIPDGWRRGRTRRSKQNYEVSI
jgi:hypothetical protein